MSPTALELLFETMLNTLPGTEWWTAERIMAAANVGVVLIATITAAIGLRAILQTREIIRQNEIIRSENSATSLTSQRQQEEYNRLASISAESQAESMKLQRLAVERANRPILMARYLPPKHSLSDLSLEISNVSNSVAYNVQVRFDPPLPDPDLEALNANTRPSTTYHRPNVDFATTVFADRTFQTWVPGQKVTVPFWVPHKDYETYDRSAPSAEGIPADQKVYLIYRNEAFSFYEEAFELDPGIWAGTLFTDSDATKQRKAMEKLANTAEDQGRIVSQFLSIARKLAPPRAGDD